MEQTRLGIPALFQSEGVHGFTNNGTTWPSPIGLSSSFNTELLQQAAATIASEAEALGVTQIFAPVLDLSRELRWGRVEENYGEDPFLTGEMGNAYVTGLQSGQRRNVSSTAIGRMAATCKHFAAFGSPQGGLNLAQVTGGERELRTYYLKPFNRACVNAFSIMTAYSSYDGIPAVSNKHLLTDILRTEWEWPYWATCGKAPTQCWIDLLISSHQTCDSRACAAKMALENGVQGEMGGGSYTYETLPDQIKNGSVDISYLDETAKTMLRTKFALGLFENPYPYEDYLDFLRTNATRTLLHQMEREAIILLKNSNNILPLSNKGGSVALIGPQANRVTFGDYVFFNASLNGISPLDGAKQVLAGTDVVINFAQGCQLWSNDQSGFAEAVATAEASDVAVVMVGTWSLDQTLLWEPGTNATTGEHVDLSDLTLVGAQLDLVKAIQATGKPTIVVFVSGKPVAEPWIAEYADAVVQQFYPGELGGVALAEILFGYVNPSGKLPVSFPRTIGTTPVFYNYLKTGRPIDPGMITPNGTLVFGHQVRSILLVYQIRKILKQPLYTDLKLSKATIGTNENFTVTVTVHNTGSIDGKEVIQIYATDSVSSVVTPNQFLVGFQKIDIPAGGSQTVNIQVLSEQLAVWTLQNQWSVEPGQFVIKVGNSAETYAQTILTVTN
ncbi:hypothetical protein Clacol_008357 [Clathrus columnatus]|uniref:Fibronectin type III-like domain-containing protein n=1 Tax=Clathrus columnatus TaxID=1419009 RepID=A0AAV5AI89_9AGAM|nr:hypothetical protein Clacol_008357 [Clathrus columnatus]